MYPCRDISRQMWNGELPFAADTHAHSVSLCYVATLSIDEREKPWNTKGFQWDSGVWQDAFMRPGVRGAVQGAALQGCVLRGWGQIEGPFQVLPLAPAPASSASAASRALRFCDFDGAAVDGEGFAVDEGVGDFPMCRLDDPAERLPRNVHLRRRLFLVETFEVRQPDRLQFVDGQLDAFEHLQRYPTRLVVRRLRQLGYPSALSGSGHS